MTAGHIGMSEAVVRRYMTNGNYEDYFNSYGDSTKVYNCLGDDDGGYWAEQVIYY